MRQKVVYISGGTSGINLGIAKAFAEQGARVLVFGRDRVKAENAAAALRDYAGGALVMHGCADVRD